MPALFSARKCLFAALAGAGLFSAEVVGAEVTLDAQIKPLLKEFCYGCHNAKDQKGDLDLELVANDARFAVHRDAWEKSIELLESREMPPEKKPQPTEEQRQLLVKWIDGQLSKFDCKTEANPGKVTLRRLNREEYRNTIRDLVRVNYNIEDLPTDDVGYGFDNIGDVLSLSPMLMEKFMAAAEEIASKAIVADPNPKRLVQRIPATNFKSDNKDNKPYENNTLAFVTNGYATRDVDIRGKGEWIVRVRVWADQGGPELPKLAVRAKDKQLHVFEITTGDQSAVFEARVPLESGWQKLAVGFINDYGGDQAHPDPKMRGDRNIFLEWVEIEPTSIEQVLPESHRQIIKKVPQPGQERAVARELLTDFARRAYRRPPTEAEIARLVGFVELALREKGSFAEGMQVAVQAVLCSPHFLFRWELDSRTAKAGDVRDLNDFEVASRLAYFLWSSMPDDELLALAERGELRKNGNLEKQVARMMKDWRVRGFVSNFAGQWLQIRNIWEMSPDERVFKKWKDSLKGSLKEEAELFFQAVMQEDRSVLDLIDADFTFLNEQLAKFYGIDGVNGSNFRRVQLPPESPRGGVVTMGAVLLTTSTPTRTSPVIRGKWILEQILGTPPPAPPPDVPPLPEGKGVDQSLSLRARLDEHNKNVECAACHKRMDPLGFALENFDGVGGWRDADGKWPIDASGALPNGRKFNGPRELKTVLKSKQFLSNFTEKMLTYALGRGLDYYDRCAVDEVVKKMEPQGNKFSALVAGIVTSEPFLKRKTAEALAQR